MLGLAATLALAACGGGDGSEPPAVTPTATAAAATQTEPATEATTPSPTPTATATPEPARDPGAEAAAAIEAASALLDAAHIEPFNRDSCLEANPESLICISLQSPPAQVAAGIARFRAGDLEGGAFIFFMGRKADGTWALWFATQQRYDVLDSLPGLLLTCGVGRPVTVREGPSATAVETGAVEHRRELVAAEFVLEDEGTLTAGGQWGSGWYRVTSPVSGWVSDADVTDAGLGDCLLHDDLRGERG